MRFDLGYSGGSRSPLGANIQRTTKLNNRRRIERLFLKNFAFRICTGRRQSGDSGRGGPWRVKNSLVSQPINSHLSGPEKGKKTEMEGGIIWEGVRWRHVAQGLKRHKLCLQKAETVGLSRSGENCRVDTGITMRKKKGGKIRRGATFTGLQEIGGGNWLAPLAGLAWQNKAQKKKCHTNDPKGLREKNQAEL